MTRWMTLGGAALGVALAATGARADITIGGDARAFAMGGAGVATFGTLSGGARNNPAALAFDGAKLRFLAPNVGFRSDGPASLVRGYEYLLQGNQGGNATQLARDFARADSSFGLNASIGLRVGPVEVLAGAVGIGRIQPNASLRGWAASNFAGSAPNDARADLLAAGVVTLPSVGTALTLPTPSGQRYRLAVGGRVKYLRGYYSHYVANKAALDSGTTAPLAPEMGGAGTLERDGVAADVGAMWQERDGGPLSLGVVVTNLVKPNFVFAGTDRNGAATRYDLLFRTVSVGAAFNARDTSFAADLVDLFGAAGKAQLRAGGEQRLLGGKIALRAGYSSTGGAVYGAGIFGFDIAFGKNQPLEVVRTIRF